MAQNRLVVAVDQAQVRRRRVRLEEQRGLVEGPFQLLAVTPARLVAGCEQHPPFLGALGGGGHAVEEGRAPVVEREHVDVASAGFGDGGLGGREGVGVGDEGVGLVEVVQRRILVLLEGVLGLGDGEEGERQEADSGEAHDGGWCGVLNEGRCCLEVSYMYAAMAGMEGQLSLARLRHLDIP